jgi:hypothetical protein
MLEMAVVLLVFEGFEPSSLLTIIKESVSVNLRECAKAISCSMNGLLYFWLSKQALLKFSIFNLGICDANFFKFSLFTHPESMGTTKAI